MLNSRKLALRKETLAELSGPELMRVAGAAASGDTVCFEIGITIQTYVTCVDTITIATCTCPPITGPTCVCPTDFVC